MIIIVCFVGCLTGCQKGDNNSQDILDNSFSEIEEYIMAGIEYQHALNAFNKEIKNIDFSKLNTYQDSKGNIIVDIPTSVSIEERLGFLMKRNNCYLINVPKLFRFPQI
jgi:hypothetical protein